MLFRMTFRVIKQPPVPTKRAAVRLIKIQSCNEFFSMLPVCVSSHLKWVLRHKFLILDSLYFREQDCKDTWLFFVAKRCPLAKKLGNTALGYLSVPTDRNLKA